MHAAGRSGASLTMAKTSQRWVVRLGELHWRRYTHARTADDGLELLGSVEKGAQVGALGLGADGRYYQVNGDYLSPLSNSQLRSAVRRAQVAVCAEEKRARYAVNRATPVVVVKKRRIVAPAPAEPMAGDGARQAA